MKILSLMTLIVTILSSSATYARGAMIFGDQEKLHFIEKVKLKGAKGEDLYIGYRTKGKYFIAGVYFKDYGYILGDRHNLKGEYYKLSKEKIRAYQQRKLLPTPLPEYDIPIFDYVFGYSLWLILAMFIISGIISMMKNNGARVE